MSWNDSRMSLFRNIHYGAFFRNRQTPDALRWRIALTYAVAFFLTTLLCFALIYITQHHVHYKTMRKRLTASSDVLEVEYMRGSPLDATEECEPWHKVPELLRENIMSTYPAFIPRLAVKSDGKFREVLGILNGKAIRIPVNTDQKTIGTPLTLPPKGNQHLLQNEFQEDISEERSYPFIFLHLSANGTLLSSTPLTAKGIQNLLDEEAKNPTPQSEHVYTERERKNNEVLLHKRRLYDGTVLIAGLDTSDAERSLRHLLVLFFIAIVIVPFLGGAVGWFVGKRISNDIRRITKSAKKIRNSGDYTARLQHGTEGREINELIDAFNAMVERTETLLTELKTMSDNVIHDLRTPITRLRARAELAIRENENRELASDIAEECANMLEIINTTLEISQVESGAAGKHSDLVDLTTVIENIAELYSVAAEDAEITVAFRKPDRSVSIVGDKTKLQRLVANLLDNALKYTPSGGRVTIELNQIAEQAQIRITDTGCGISDDDLKQIFNRFYRADSSRTRPGNGLGLCLVKAIAEAHGGSVSAVSKVGRGTSFTVLLPVNSAEK